MERRKIKADPERDLLKSLILSDEFVRDIRLILDLDLLRNPYTRTVAEWCVDYFESYEEAPKSEIESVFNREREYLDSETVAYIERLLVSLDTPGNIGLRLDIAEEYLKTRKLEILVDQIKGDLQAGQVSKAESRVSGFERVARPQGEGIDVFEDFAKVGQAIAEQDVSMLRVPGILGDMLGDFYRGDLVAVAGPPKRGKSWWLMFFTLCAYNAGYKVLFISLEMLEKQVLRRFVQMLTSTGRKDRTIEVPSFDLTDDDKYRVIHTPLQVRKSTVEDWTKAVPIFRRHNKDSRLKLLTFPQDTLTVADLEVHLENMEHFDDFVPDVIVVDYADILAPEHDSPREHRHQLNHTWKKLRRLAQARECLVYTGSQTDRTTLSRDAGAGNIAEDMRKLAHVAKLVGLNQSKYERKLGLMRLALWMERHENAYATEEVVVSQALGIGKPYIDSRWKKDVEGVYDDSRSKGTK